MVKDHFGANLEDLDFKEVDKEMEANEAAQAIVATKENVLEEDIADPKGAPTNVAGGDEAVTYTLFFFSCLLWWPMCIGLYFWCPLYFLGFRWYTNLLFSI